MDLEAESIVNIDMAMSTDITDSCKKLLETQKKIATAEDELKKLKEVETNHSTLQEYQHLEVKKLLIGYVQTAMEI